MFTTKVGDAIMLCVENKDNNLEGKREKAGQEFPISAKQRASMTPIPCPFRLTPLIQSTLLYKVLNMHTQTNTQQKQSQILKRSLCKFIFHIHIPILVLYVQTKKSRERVLLFN